MRMIRPFLPMVLLAIALAGCAGSATSLPTVGGPVGDAVGKTLGSGAGAGAASIAAPNAGAADAVGARDDAKIIRTGTMDLEVRDVPSALRAARDAIVAVGGYVGASTTKNEAITFPAGKILVRTAQPLANLAFYLLEAESDSGFVNWNFLDEYLEKEKTYPVYKLMSEVKVASRLK